MAARFVNIDYDTPLLLPPDLRDWVPVGHLAHFILDVVEEIDLRQVRVNERGTGSEQYPPRMLLALLLYCYATGVFGSRRIDSELKHLTERLAKLEKTEKNIQRVNAMLEESQASVNEIRRFEKFMEQTAQRIMADLRASRAPRN